MELASKTLIRKPKGQAAFIKDGTYIKEYQGS